jgi:hypothetical protein
MIVRLLSQFTHPSQSRTNDPQHVKPTTFIFSNQCFPTASISASPTIAFPLPSIIITIYCIHTTGIPSPFGTHPLADDTKSITVAFPTATVTTVPRDALSLRSPCPPAPVRYSTVLVLYRDTSVRFARPSVSEPSGGLPRCHQALSSDKEFFWWRP